MRIPIVASATLIAVLAAAARAQTHPPPAVEGEWRGTLVNYPLRAGAPEVEVWRTIGAWPVADSSCTVFRTIYRERGVQRGEKAYRLCRGRGADDLVIDEGDGVRLPSRWIGDQLISPFKYDSTLLISTMRLQADTLIEDILTVADRSAASGVVGLHARGVQRLRLVRVRQK
jgi:hypothetical protein